MSVLINMKMPKSCDVCIFDNGVNCMAYPQSEDMVYDIKNGKPDWCPLVELEDGKLFAVKDNVLYRAELTHLIEVEDGE